MKRRPWLKQLLFILSLIVLVVVVVTCWVSFPIINGYGAKVLCSAVFVSDRNEKDIINDDLNFFPVNLANYSVDYKDSSVTTTLLGLAKRKAIYRKGLGATLVSELTEAQVRAEKFVLPVKPSIDPDTIVWPMGNKMTDSFPANINRAKLTNAVDDAFKENDKGHLIKTRAVVILYKGNLIAEKYAKGFSKNTRLAGWSMTKSIANALIGLLVKDNKLQVDSPAPVAEWKALSDPRHSITLKNLLQQTSGLQFNESYTHNSDATRMLFMKAAMGTYTAQHTLQNKPGTIFYYSSGNSNLLSCIVRETVGDKYYYSFPYQQLFYKLGMYSAVLEPDASGTFVGSSYCYATARDWARFGLLYINNGFYNHQQILSPDWIKQTTTPATAAKKGQYGYQFWLNAGEKNNPSNRTYPHAPADMFCAIGFEGQNVCIIPSKQLVIVRLGLTQNDHYNADKFISNVVNCIQ